MTHAVAQLAAVLATALFIFSLHWMNDPKTARRGVAAGVTGMLVAVVATWIQPEIIHHGWVALAIVAGAAGALVAVVVTDRRLAAEMTRFLLPRSGVRIAVVTE